MGAFAHPPPQTRRVSTSPNPIQPLPQPLRAAAFAVFRLSTRLIEQRAITGRQTTCRRGCSRLQPHSSAEKGRERARESQTASSPHYGANQGSECPRGTTNFPRLAQSPDPHRVTSLTDISIPSTAFSGPLQVSLLPPCRRRPRHPCNLGPKHLRLRRAPPDAPDPGSRQEPRILPPPRPSPSFLLRHLPDLPRRVQPASPLRCSDLEAPPAVPLDPRARPCQSFL